MECWSFPPRYDESWAPPPDVRYWFPERETMDPGAREAAIVERLRAVMEHAWTHSAFYRRKWDAAGVHPGHVTSLEAFERVPAVTKAELRAAQSEHPPFGDYLCIPPGEVRHIHGTSGTTGRPTAFGIGGGDWRAIANAQARILWAMGLRPGDRVFIAAIFSLYLGSWGAMLGAERLGCQVFPFGAGAPGMTARAVSWLAAMGAQGFYSTPSYALHLAETARAEGVDPRRFGLKTMFFSGEPGASIPGVRDRIAEAFGARVYDCGTMAEMTPFMSAAETDGGGPGMLLWQDIVYHEVCDPGTLARVPYGARGTPVYTHLERTSQPMIRLMSGDLARWEAGPSPCGRTYPCFPEGVFGRIDDMFQVRGENIYPSEIDNALNGLDGYAGEHRIVVTRESAMDELLVRAEADNGAAFAPAAAAALQKVLGVRARVEVLAPGTLPRTDHKARRVIDDREMFRAFAGREGA